MSFKINIDERRVRSVNAKVETLDPETDEVKIEELPVEYYAWTIAESRRWEESVKQSIEAKETKYVSEALVSRIRSLPTVVEKCGKPIKITVANLEKIPLDILQAINAAIEEDQVPKPRPLK